MTEAVHQELSTFLLRADGQEDPLFALYAPSVGAERFTALITTVVYPQAGDREVHGNASFRGQYLERVQRLALEQGRGVVFLHSHLGPGWQGVSHDDVRADRRISQTAVAVTDLPMLSMTLGIDGTWSARAWSPQGERIRACWATHVRVVGSSLAVSFADHLRPAPKPTTLQRRTVAVWGEAQLALMTRLTIGIVGLGSVGSQVCEGLARAGFTRLVLIDHDRVEAHNLDRLTGTYREDLGELKVEVAGRNALQSSTAVNLEIRRVPHSVTGEEGYRTALDCDVLFSCVDRPHPRRLLDHLASAHLIPVIDGGIRVHHQDGQFRGVNWQVQTAGPGRPCLQCVGAFDAGEADMDAKGLLDDPSCVAGLPEGNPLKASENVFSFSSAVASLETLQLFALVTGFQNFGVQRFDFNAGSLEAYVDEKSGLNCQCKTHLLGTGDTLVDWHAHDLILEAQRKT